MSLGSVGRSFGSSWGTWESWASQPLVSVVSFPIELFFACPLTHFPKKKERRGKVLLKVTQSLLPLRPEKVPIKSPRKE